MTEFLLKFGDVVFIESDKKGTVYGIEKDQFAIINSSGGMRLKKEEARKMAEEILEILEIY